MSNPIVFKWNKHKKLWNYMKNNYDLTRRVGLVKAKEIIRSKYLDDNRTIPNSCYACEFAFLYSEQHSSPAYKCFCCPIKVSKCSRMDSWMAQLTYAVQEGNKQEYIRLCEYMENIEVKDGVICGE